MIAADARCLAIIVARIGDTLLVTPALRAIRAACPRGRLSVYAHPKRRVLLENQPFIDALGALTKVSAPLRGRFVRERYDHAFVWGHDAALIRYARRVSRQVIAFRQKAESVNALLDIAVPPPAGSIHAVRERLLLADAAGITAAGLRLAYGPRAEERAAARAWCAAHLPRTAQPLVGVQLASFATKTYRDWPLDHFVALAERLFAHAPHAHLLLLGGPQDRARAQALAARFPGRASVVAGLFTLRGAAALQAQLDAYIGVDTGPTHIAGALGLPMVALYHCRHPGINLCPLEHPAPLHVIEHPDRGEACRAESDMRAIGVDQVWTAVRALLDARPGAGR